MSPLLVNVLTFSGAFLAVFAANALLVELRAPSQKQAKLELEKRYRALQQQRARASAVSKDFSEIAAEVRAQQGRGQGTLGDQLRQLSFLIEQSGLNVSLGRILAICAAVAVAAAVGAWFLLVDWALALAAALVGLVLPLAFVHFKRHERLEKLRRQLPSAFELMSRVMRSGQTVSQAMHAVAKEFSRPISLEFLYCYEQMNLGLSQEVALRELARRTGMLEVRIFVLAVLVHRQTGGNLAELLDKLAQVVRERFRIRGMIQSLTAQGRLQAVILMSLPPGMFLLLLTLSYDYEARLFEYPQLIVIGLAMMTFGWLWIRKIINFDF